MSEASPQETELLDRKLDSALEEAWSKINRAHDQTLKKSENLEKEIWLASEAVEYSSLLFNLTYGLEDLDPKVDDKKNADLLALVRDSVELVKQAREKREESPEQAYVNIRTAAHYLKRAYLSGLKRTTKAGPRTIVRSKP